jgi:hypothetical protein
MKRAILLIYSTFFLAVSYANAFQDTTAKPLNISGSIGLTNNGISIIPTFSLNAPATITNFYISKNRFSFEPDVRLTLDARKGGMLFWFRYKFIKDKKFNLSAEFILHIIFSSERLLRTTRHGTSHRREDLLPMKLHPLLLFQST